MKISFFPKLAIDGMRKNRRLYLPYLLTCIGMVTMEYIVIFLCTNQNIRSIKGGEQVAAMMGLGSYVIFFFAALFLFYTNSFLIRRRKKEFGLYNILGMGKRHIAKILFWETLVLYGLSIVIGCIAGIAFSKMAELGLLNVLKSSVNFNLSVSGIAILRCMIMFGIIFLLLFLNSVRQVKFSSAINMLRSENAGEKAPKANWLLGILGVVVLMAAYYIALQVKNPLSALLMFFVAVLMVILATYLIMISGSVLMCRILQKNTRYYYKANHFVSVSSMMFRMKRNGAGLASICILSTMVLVIMSSTFSVFVGAEDSLRSRYPREIDIEMHMSDETGLSDEKLQQMTADVNALVEDYNCKVTNIQSYREMQVSGILNGDSIYVDPSKAPSLEIGTSSNLYTFHFVLLEDYNKMTGSDYQLEDGEALLYTFRSNYHASEKIHIENCMTLKIAGTLTEFTVSADISMDVVPAMIFVVPSFESIDEKIGNINVSDEKALLHRWYYYFDLDESRAGAEEDYETLRQIFDAIRAYAGTEEVKEKYGITHSVIECRDHEKEDFYASFGGLLYLGSVLSIVFLFAAVLIIYYKQICEGYEDQARFDMMQKVGMTKKDIRRSINSQLLTVFYLPLVMAGLHLAFAFPMISKLLTLFNFNNTLLFGCTTVGCFVLFAVFYAFIYRMTSNAYYKIVSGAREE